MFTDDAAVRELFAPEIRAQEEVRLRRGLAGEKLRLAARNLLDSEDGKLFICEVLDETGTFASSFTGNSSTFFLEGKRYVGLFIYQVLMLADPLALQKLLDFRREHQALLRDSSGNHGQ